MGFRLMRVGEPSNAPIRPNDDAGSVADVYRAIESLKGRRLEGELAGLRKARERLLAAVPEAAERARLAEPSADESGSVECSALETGCFLRIGERSRGRGNDGVVS